MFNITDTLKFTHKVPVFVPVDGGHIEQSLTVTYQIGPDAGDTAPDPAADGLTAFLKEIVVNIGGVMEDGKELPWSDALRDRLLGWPIIRSALYRGYLSAITKAKAGN